MKHTFDDPTQSSESEQGAVGQLLWNEFDLVFPEPRASYVFPLSVDLNQPFDQPTPGFFDPPGPTALSRSS